MTATAIQIDGLTKSFDGRTVLDGVGLTVARGKIVSIIGSSGGGKTTLMRCVNLLERPDRAEMQIDGEPIFAGDRMVCRDLPKLRRSVGMVFQRFYLFPHLTAVENVMLPQLKAAGTLAQEQVIRKAATDEMVQAVEREGLTVDQFRAISVQMERSPEMARRVEEHAREAAGK